VIPHITSTYKPFLNPCLEYSDCIYSLKNDAGGKSSSILSIPNLALNRMAVKILMEFSMNGLKKR